MYQVIVSVNNTELFNYMHKALFYNKTSPLYGTLFFKTLQSYFFSAKYSFFVIFKDYKISSLEVLSIFLVSLVFTVFSNLFCIFSCKNWSQSFK